MVKSGCTICFCRMLPDLLKYFKVISPKCFGWRANSKMSNGETPHLVIPNFKGLRNKINSGSTNIYDHSTHHKVLNIKYIS